MSSTKKFLPERLFPLPKGTKCQIHIHNKKARMKFFDDNDPRCTDITPTFFPASKKPTLAQKLDIYVQLAFVARSADGRVCLMIKRDDDGRYSLPLPKMREGMSFLDVCHEFVAEWIDHDWWFKQLAVFEEVPNISTHNVHVVYGQWMPVTQTLGRDNFFWAPVDVLMSWKEETLHYQLYEFIRSPVCEAWCRRFDSLYPSA